jgi:ABC-2 type transport system permease protein
MSLANSPHPDPFPVGEGDDSRAYRGCHPLASLVLARVREFVREPAAIFWVYVFPVVLVVTLGAAFRNRPTEAFRVGVLQGKQAVAVAAALNRDGRFRASVCGDPQGRLDLRTGRSNLLVKAGEGPPPRLEYFFDPTRPEGQLARNAADDLLEREAGRRDVATTQDHPIDEPGGRYIDFLVPGLLGMGLMGGGLWGVGFAIVDMRIRKLLKRYVATPMKRSHFLAAVILSRLLFTLPEVLLVLLLARLIFGVAVAGSYLAIGLLILLGCLEFSGIGLLVASRAQTIETVSGLMNAVMLPMWIGSGIFFSTQRFPQAVQPVLNLLPLTPLIDAMRRVMLEGAGLASQGVNLALIAAWGCATFALALRWFRWS